MKKKPSDNSQNSKNSKKQTNTSDISKQIKSNKVIHEKDEDKTKKDKIIIDFKEILKHSEITTNEKVNFSLYLELMNNLDKKDDIKTLGICRLILSQDPNNVKIKELHDIIYESIKNHYYESGELEEPNEESMDKHMKLNKDGEYEYVFSDESEEDEKE